MKFNCPKCTTEINASIKAFVPDSHKISVRYTAGEAAESWDAETIGKSMVAMAKLQKSVAKQMGATVQVYIDFITVTPHEIEIGYFMTPCVTYKGKKLSPKPKEQP